jgi:peptidoglycan/LPS O-acetylase OafA/YrhL
MSKVVIHGEGLAKPTALNFSGRIPELDGLRGLAIFLVILCHYVGGADHAPLGFFPHRALLAFTVGWSGVDLFFVLSGFLIGGILLDARNSPHYFRAFYMRRVFRILPIYYLWTLLFAVTVIVVLLFFPGGAGVASKDLLRVPTQLLFLQNIFIGMPHFTWIWFVVTWSLAIEEQFYLIAPPLIRFLSLRHLVTALATTIVLAPVLRFLLFRYWAPGTYLCAYLMPCRADSLSCGILLAVAWRNASFRELLRAHAALLQRVLFVLFLGVGGLLWWLVHPINVVTVTIGYTWLALFYSALLLTAVSQPAGWLAAAARWRFLGRLGGISYCVYLLHDAFNYFAHAILLHSEPRLYTLGQLGVTALALLATLVVASLSWRFLEKPLILRGHSYSYGEGAVGAPPSVLEGDDFSAPEVARP